MPHPVQVVAAQVVPSVAREHERSSVSVLDSHEPATHV